MYNEQNDYELLYLIREENEEAYNDIYKKYGNLIKKIANKVYKNSKYLGCSFDDVYNAGIYGLEQAIKYFDENEGILFYTFAMSFVTKEIINFVRENNRNKHNILSNCISLNQEIDEDGKMILDFIKSKEIDPNYIDVMSKYNDFKYELPFKYSLVYELRINNFSNQEISQLLDIDYKMIDNYMRYIKEKLKKKINNF